MKKTHQLGMDFAAPGYDRSELDLDPPRKMTDSAGQAAVDTYLAANTERRREDDEAPPKMTDAECQAAIDRYLAADTERRREIYEARRERRRDGLERAADRAKQAASDYFGAAHRAVAPIPFGQPILVGHHSERRHRSALAKHDRSMRRAIEADKHGAKLAARAAAVGTGGISSDDPDAVVKLKKEVAELKARQEQWKRRNLDLRAQIKAGLDPAAAERHRIPTWQLTNNAANIRRIEKRIQELGARDHAAEQPPVSGSIDGLDFTIRENRTLNRVQVVFDGKPPEGVRSRLKSYGFKWAPSEGAWQRQLSNQAWHRAHVALGLTI